MDYVVVGGYAAQLHGAARPTIDLDVTPAVSVDNLERLAAALRELGARIRVDGVPEGLPWSVTGQSLVGQRMRNLVTQHGELDLTIFPAGFEGGYDDLVQHAGLHQVGQVQVRVAALNDVIASKEAAGRRKDQEALPELLALARAQQTREGGAAPEPAPAKSEVQPAPASAQDEASRAGVRAALMMFAEPLTAQTLAAAQNRQQAQQEHQGPAPAAAVKPPAPTASREPRRS